jgi:hypothetical protein
MQPLAIIEPFNKRKDLPTGFVPSVIRLMMNKFMLRGAEEALGHRVVVTVPLPAHTRRAEAKGSDPLNIVQALNPLSCRFYCPVPASRICSSKC